MHTEQVAAFAAVFAALFAGHSFGDHWVQTGRQAVCKGFGPPSLGQPDATRLGQRACLAHVATLQLTKLVLVAVVWALYRIDLVWWQVTAAFLVDGASHYWADRRYTLEKLARRVKKIEFHDQGTDLVDRAGETRPHVGTGKYALDQSWHHLWLFIAAVIATA